MKLVSLVNSSRHTMQEMLTRARNGQLVQILPWDWADKVIRRVKALDPARGSQARPEERLAGKD